jgi:hypothetical protein
MGLAQGCQMAYFQTLNAFLGKLRVLQWKMFVYDMAIWSVGNILWPFGIHILWLFGIFFTFLVGCTYQKLVWSVFLWFESGSGSR